MSEGQTGRSRARARGRARGQPPVEPARRPTEIVPAAPPVTQPPQPAGTGRAFHRGAAHTEPRPVEAVRTGMEQMRLESSGGLGRGATRGRRLLDDFLRTRPEHVEDKRGVSGDPIRLYANYFKLVKAPNWVIYQYHVDFAPTIESPKMRRAMLFDHLDKLGNSFVFDGMSDLKTTTKLTGETEMYSQRRTDGENIRITLKMTGELPPHHPEIIRLFNTQMRRNLFHMKFVAMGRHCFDPNAVSGIPQHKIELWQGITTAIRQYETSLMMVVDTVHKVLRLDSVLDQMKGFYNQDQRNYTVLCQKELTGSIVSTRYNHKNYKIDDIDFNKNPMSTFESKKTGTISYMDYYKKQYDLTIQDTQQPLLICRNQERSSTDGKTENIYLIPEFCNMTGLTDAMRSDFNLMRDMAQHTRIGPDKRVENLKIFIQRLNQNQQVVKEMTNLGLKFEEKLVEIQARVVPGEKIRQQGQLSTFKNGDFSREMRSKSMHVPMDLNRFAVIVSRRDSKVVDDFLENLHRVCPPMGMKVTAPKVVTTDDDKASSYLSAMASLMKENLQLIICIVPNNRKDRYDAIKKRACIDSPIATQVIVARTLSKKQMLMAVATKIGIQINCKLGGEAWAVDIPLKQKTMVLGFDTYHDSSQKGLSVGALVASMNSTFTSWFSKSSFHRHREELSDFLNFDFTLALKKFHQINKDLPDIILFYRDGVSDGQIAVVQEHEVQQCLKAYSNLADGKMPRFAFIVVNKRISTKFFALNNGNGIGNPPSGTVVDLEVTRPERYDFYLVSQSVRQGTVAPTLYNVIHDTSGLRPEHMQRITYKLTHLYYNWQGTIRVPAPCQYAHKLAFLVGQSLHKDPAEQLQSVLYYL